MLDRDQPTRVRISETDATLKVRDIPIGLCRPDPNQPRQAFDEESLQELANSIDRHRLLQPITVKRDAKKRGHYVVVAGERRFRAFELLERETIPAVITTGDADEIALIENLQREDLSPLEEAQALARLKKKHGYTLKALGQSIGKAESTVSNLLKINDLPAKIRKDLSTSKVAGRSFLIEIARLDDKKQQLKLWKEVQQGTLTIRDLRRQKRSAQPAASPTAGPQQTVALGKRFITELNKLNGPNGVIDDASYEELLAIYEDFVTFFDRYEV